MFSGLTNQVSSWMGTAKGEQEEQVPTPTDESNSVINPDDKKDVSPTKHSKLDMLANVKNQFGGWLGSGIPGLRKGDAPHENAEEIKLVQEGDTPASEMSVKGSLTEQKDDDDNSSATGGADSGPASIAGTPTEEKDAQLGGAAAVSTKAIAGVKSFGNFLYSAANKAGAKVAETGAKIKKTVGENTILGEFNKEQEAFMKNQSGQGSAAALPPWSGCQNEEALKEECLSLSTDKRNFVRSPPAGVDFQFDYDVSYPIAIATMAEDPNLEKMRFDLVPKIISEENFWRNYFYRVSLICQANELSFMTRDSDTAAASEQPIDVKDSQCNEFVSDSLQPNTQDLAEVREGMKKLGMGSKHCEEEWEKELEAELQDYEVVTESNKSSVAAKNENWEKEMEEMLEEETDLK